MNKTNVNEYAVINVTDIQKRIEELEKDLKTLGDVYEEEIHAHGLISGGINQLKKIISQSTPLIPEIEKAFDAGSSIESWSDFGVRMTYENSKKYIKNLKLDI